jgi:hypothetical protein
MQEEGQGYFNEITGVSEIEHKDEYSNGVSDKKVDEIPCRDECGGSPASGVSKRHRTNLHLEGIQIK